MPIEPSTRPPQAPLVVAGVVFALLATIAVASRDASVWAAARWGTIDRAGIVVTLALLLVVYLTVAGLVTSAVHRVIMARGAHSPGLRVTLLAALPMTTITFGVIGLMVITGVETGPPAEAGARSELDLPGQPSKPFDIDWWNPPVVAGEDQRGFEQEGAAGSEPDPPSRVAPLLVLTGAVLAALASAVWWHARSRANDDGPEPGGKREAARGAVIGTIDAMLADPNPRTAIIGAYARLLEGMAAWGTPRRDYEAPLEHLGRALTILDVRVEPSRRLVDLFEIARFSTHTLTSGHRDQALRALRDVAADLEGGAAPAPAGRDPVGRQPVGTGR